MQDAFAHCEALVRAGDKERFLSALFAPADKRGALHALYAFNLEIARVREVARESLAGEIRLQWWADVLAGEARGDARAHPVAAALGETIARYALPRELLAGLIEARRFDLYDEPMQTLAELASYANRTASALIALVARVLMDGADPGIGALADNGGFAHAIAGLLSAFPAHAARGQLYVPLEILTRHGGGPSDAASRPATPALRAALTELRAHARRHLAAAGELVPAMPVAIVPALLPLALVRPLLDRMERRGYDPFVSVDIPQWRRQWLIWRAARKPVRITG